MHSGTSQKPEPVINRNTLINPNQTSQKSEHTICTNTYASTSQITH